MENRDRQEVIKDLLNTNPKGLTIEEISKKLSFNRSTVVKYLNTMVASGQAEMRTLGRAKLFYLSQRLPLTDILSLTTKPILILDNDHFIREVNGAFLNCFNVSKPELMGSKIEYSPLAFHFNDEWLISLEKALDGTNHSLEVCIRGRENQYFKVVFIPLVFEGGGKAAGVILEDISEMKVYQQNLEAQVRERTAELIKTNKMLVSEIEERKKIEASLKQSERCLADIINFLPDATFAIDHSGRVIAWNRAIEDLTGISSIEMNGKENFEYAIPFYGVREPIIIDFVIRPELEIPGKNRYHYIQRKGDMIISEAYVPTFNKGKGSHLWCMASPLYNPKGTIVGAIESIRNISEHKQVEDELNRKNRDLFDANQRLISHEDVIRKQYEKLKESEKSLRESERMYRTLFENTGAATIIIDEDTTLSLVNTRFEQLSGYSRKEIEGKKKWTDFVIEQDQKRLLDLHHLRRKKKDTLKHYEFGFLNRAGEIRDILISIDMIPGTTKSTASLVDITDRIRSAGWQSPE